MTSSGFPVAAADDAIDAYFRRDLGTVTDLVALHAGIDAGRVALVVDDRSITYGELAHRMRRVACALQRDGVHVGQVVAICGATSLDYAVIYLGSLLAGVAVAPLSPSSSVGSLAAMIRDADASRVFADRSIVSLLAAADIAPAAPTILLDDETDAGVAGWLADVDDAPMAVSIAPQMLFNIIYSSGTTGEPKGIEQPHAMRWSQVRRWRSIGCRTDTVALISTPLYSNTTLGFFFGVLGSGGTLILMPKFDAGLYLSTAARHCATHTVLVPTQFQRLLAHPDFDKTDLSTLRYKSATSAPFPAALKREVIRRWPGSLVDLYGMTEGGGMCILEAHLYPDKLGTVGRPVAGHDIRIVDDAGVEVEDGQVGEVVGRSPSMMRGYRNQPELTAAIVWRGPGGDSYFRSGDVGRFDADGFLVLVDRKKDMIISGGFNIFPSDLEAVVRAHPAVADVSVVGVPSTTWGETPVAFVVAKDDGATIDAADVVAWANARLGRMQKIAAVRVVDALPRSPIGKVLKRELRARFVGGR